MKLIINGETREVESVVTVAQLLESLGLAARMVVVERNGDILSRDNFSVAPIAAGDQLEIVQMMAGG